MADRPARCADCGHPWERHPEQGDGTTGCYASDCLCTGFESRPPAPALGAICENLRLPAARLVALGQGGAYVQVMSAELLALVDGYTALTARLAVYQTALETIRDLDPLAGRVRPGSTSIGDTALAIANGLGKCQKIARGAVGAVEPTGD